MSTERDNDDKAPSSLEIAPTQYGSDISDSQAPVAPTLRAPLETGWALSTEDPSAESAFSSQESDRYEISGEHARGGLGRILEARDRRLGRPVAIKELLDPDGGAEARFLREATVTARLEHPSIVPVHDIGRWKTGGAFYAMKMVSGSSLKERIDECDGLDARLALLPNVIAVADAIAYAHSEGVIHRDLKPQNVVVGPFGETVVIDWGLAKDERAGELDEPGDEVASYRPGGALTVVGAVMGTPAYMPPEQARGEEVDERADVYSLGAMLYHVITGRAPYGRDKSQDVLSEVIAGPPPAIDPHELHAPEDLVAIVTMAMARDPDERYPSARELVADLRRFHTGKLVSAREYSTWRLVLRWVASHRAIVAVATIALIVVAVLAAVSVAQVLSEKRAAERQRVVAEKRALDLLEEKGRSELIEGKPLRALVYLSEAYASGADTPALRVLIRDAMRTIDALEIELPVADSPLVALDVDARGTRAVVAAESGVATLWDLSARRAIQTFDTNKQRLRAIDLSPDGTRVITGSDNEGAILWDATTGARIAVLELGEFGATTVEFSPDGSLFVAAMGRSTNLFDARTGVQVRSLNDGTGQFCMDSTFSEDGTLVGCPGGDGVGRVFETATGAVLSRVSLEGNLMKSMAFSSDNELVAGTSNDGRVSVWRTRSGELVNKLIGHEGLVLGSRFIPDSYELFTWAHDTTARLWDVVAGRQIYALEGHTEMIWDLDIDLEQRRVVTASFDGTARVWNLIGGKHVATLPTPAKTNNLARFIADGDRILTAGTDGTLRVWSTRVWKPSFVLRHAADVARVEFIDDDTLMTAANDGRVRLWSAVTGELVRTFDSRRQATNEPIVVDIDEDEAENIRAIERMRLHQRNRIGDADRSADGDSLLVALGDGSVELFDWHLGTSLRNPAVHTSTIRRARFAMNDTRFVTAGGTAPAVWITESGDKEFDLTGHTDTILSLELDASATRAVTASADGTARIWDLATGLSIATLEGHDGDVARARFHPDGHTVVTASADGTARLWDAERGSSLAVLRGHADVVTDARFSPDGAYVVTVSEDKTAKVWASSDGALITSLDGHSAPVKSAAFSRNGSVVVTGSLDTTAGVWTLPGGKLLATLDVHAARIDHVASSPDGTRIATAGRDQVAVVWDASGDSRTPGEIAAIVAARVPWTLVDGRLIPRLREP